MPDLLLELFSEEIPARMQRQGAEDLKRLVTGALVERGLLYEGAQSFATPRRLALHIVGLPAEQAGSVEERKGPRTSAPEAAIQGFLKSAGLARIEDAKIENDPKKGEFYVARIERPGRATIQVIAEILPAIIRAFPWPKSMRWGAASVRSDALRWVRPLRSILCTFTSQHETPEIVKFDIDGLAAGDITYGHRFMAPGAIRVRRFEDYVDSLAKARVVLDSERRKQIILADARSLALAHRLELIEDENLLEEVAGLVEWPIALMGEFEPAFLEIPPEVIRATIRANQKCFVLREAEGMSPASSVMAGLVPATHAAPKSESATSKAPRDGVRTNAAHSLGDGRDKPGHDEGGSSAATHSAPLANKFILVANLVASDGGAAIAAGNGRVVRARLSDARHFWLTDLAPLPDYKDKADKPLDQRLAKLRALGIVFHEKLGTQGERIDRIAALAEELAPLVGADPALARRAALLAKADLVSEMVGEFPELQGLMGRYYAAEQREDASVTAAIEEHYKPQGPNDRNPTAPVSIAVALADKFDALAGFWYIDEKPTGSKDPYALRRAALGVIRIIVENSLRLSLNSILNHAFDLIRSDVVLQKPREGETIPLNDLAAFFAERLKVYLRDKGFRHDIISAAFALPLRDDLLGIVQRVNALSRSLETDDVKNLLAGYRRAANIVNAAEKKDGPGAFAESPDLTALALPQEKQLAAANGVASSAVSSLVGNQDFEGAMRELAKLRVPVDEFFTYIIVNTDDSNLRLDRLRLLNQTRAIINTVADFSKITG